MPLNYVDPDDGMRMPSCSCCLRIFSHKITHKLQFKLVQYQTNLANTLANIVTVALTTRSL